MRTAIIALGLALAGCGSTGEEIFAQCTVDVTLLSASGAAGDEVVARGGPFGQPYDNAVQVNGTQAQVVGTDRTERLDDAGVPRLRDACARCDACRGRNLGHCNRCKTTCYECVETLTFEVPATLPGDTDVLILNGWGGSQRIPFFVIGDTTPTGTGTGTGTGTSPATGTGSGTGTGTGAATGSGTGTATGSGTGSGTGTGTGVATGSGTGTGTGGAAGSGTGTGTATTGSGTGTGTGSTGAGTGTGSTVTTP